MAEGNGESSGLGPPKKKRTRVETFQPVERISLVELVEKCFSIVECKKTDAISSKAKTQQWNIIADQFNARGTFVTREAQGLRTAWENMKKMAKSVITKENQNRIATGGGPPPTPEKVDAAIEKVVILLRSVVQGFNNGLDSDSIGKDVFCTIEDDTEAETEDVTDEVDLITPVLSDNVSNVVLVDNVDGNTPVEVELSGDWSSYTGPMLRTPRTNILRKSIVYTPPASLPLPNDQQDCSAIPSNAPPSCSSTPANLNHNIPTVINGTRHLKSSSSRRRPFLKHTEAEQLAKEKIKTLAGTAQQATEEHDVMMRILLLQEQQEKEKLKQQQLATLREQVKLNQENLKLGQLQQEVKKDEF